jgi:shikimate kinase
VLISLIGLPGVGKSTVGRQLARRLGLGFVDCDTVMEVRLKSPIRAFFESEGEARFRDVECELLNELVDRDRIVLATGGGVVVRPSNRELLRTRTLCVYLRAKPEALFHRLKRDNRRPLLQGTDLQRRLRELHDERDSLYCETAAFQIEILGKSLATMVDTIVESLSGLRSSAGGADLSPS